MAKIGTCLVYIFILNLYCQADDTTLRLVNLVYRHGDRSPIAIFPTDVNQIDQWPQGLGWLSQIGMQQHFSLGQLLRQRYTSTGFMNSNYSRFQIAIESSDEDRCLMSAYSNLAGLFPPNNESRFHPDLPWQPIPVHTRPIYEDNMLIMGENCPRYNELLAETMASHAVEQEEIHNKEFYQHVGNLTGWKDENISNIWRIADTVFCEKCHNLTANPWLFDVWNKTTNQTIYDKLRHLESYQFMLLYKGKEASMLKGGPLLARWIQNMKDKITFPNNNTFKMLMYSGHDSTVAAFLTNLGLFDGVSPQYASSVVSELHEGPPGSFYVNLFYKNQTYNDTFVPLTLPGCSFNCPYDNFIRLTKDAVPIDWMKQCGYPDPQAPKKGEDKLAAGWLVSFALAGLLVVVLIIFGRVRVST